MLYISNYLIISLMTSCRKRIYNLDSFSFFVFLGFQIGFFFPVIIAESKVFYLDIV